MVEVMNISSEIFNIYNSFINSMPSHLGSFFNLMILVLLVFIYFVFIWKLYKFVAKKNFLNLNLRERSARDTSSKLTTSILYLLEYIIISPFLIFFWFAIFTIFLILLTEGIPVETILLISAIIIAVTRMASFYSEDLSKDIAKLLPFTLLAIAITTTDFFNVERIFTQLSQIPQSLNYVLTYLVFIFLLEAILRFFQFIFSLLGFEEEVEEEESKES